MFTFCGFIVFGCALDCCLQLAGLLVIPWLVVGLYFVVFYYLLLVIAGYVIGAC